MAAPAFRVEVKGVAELQSKFNSLGTRIGTVLDALFMLVLLW